MSNIVKFIKYNGSTGEILASGSCPENMLYLQGEFVLEGDARDTTHYVDLATTKIHLMPDSPGEFYSFDYITKTWLPDYSKAVIIVKEKRDYLLQQSDWTQIPDVPLETKTIWAAYRQALRDITGQSGYPYDVVWPTAPQ
jgi:hypothetical protein